MTVKQIIQKLAWELHIIDIEIENYKKQGDLDLIEKAKLKNHQTMVIAITLGLDMAELVQEQVKLRY